MSTAMSTSGHSRPTLGDSRTETSKRQQSNARLRSVIERHPEPAFTASLSFGLFAALFFVGGASQVDLGGVVRSLVVATVLGGCSLLILNELMVIELDAHEGKSTSRRSPAAKKIFRVLKHRRWRSLAVLVLLVAIGLFGPTLPGLRHVVSTSISGFSLATLAAVAGVCLFTGWALVLFLDLERGVLIAPRIWLVVGAVVALVGAIIWGAAPGSMGTVGLLLAVMGLVGVKMAFPALLDQVDAGNETIRDSQFLAANRKIRAAETTAGGTVAVISGYLLMTAGATVRNSAYLTVGLLLIVGGLSIVGIGAPRLITPLLEDQSFSDNRVRAITAGLVALGTLMAMWGSVRTVEAAGDWFLLAVVICVLMIGVGAWFAYRGEALVMLALIIFLLPWIMKDRSTIEPAHLSADNGIVVAIGDSFMSGEGADDYFRGTNTPATNQCRRADSAYAVQVAEHLDRDLRFLACSGAETKHVRLDGEGQMASSPDDVAGRDTQLNTLRLEMREARRNGDPITVDLALVSIGGNDTGFSKIIQACLLPTNCAENEELWIAKAESLTTDLADTYSQIRNVVGRDVPIVVVPYPEFISPEACGRLASREEFEFVVRFITALNNTIYRAAEQAGVLVANTSGLFADAAQCDDDPAVNLIVLSPPSGPSVLDRFGPGNWVHNSMHPKPAGHTIQAQGALNELARALVDGCDTDGASCKPQCLLADSELIDRLQAPRSNELGSLLIDNCAPPPPTTPDDLAESRTAAADLLLEQVVNDELYASAGLLITPLLALLLGGLLLAVGMAGRPRVFGDAARFLAPIVPRVPGVEFTDRRVHLVGVSSTPTEATVLLVSARPAGDRPPDVNLVVRIDKDSQPDKDGQPDKDSQPVEGASPTVGAWQYVEAGRNPYYWAKATLTGLEPGTGYLVTGESGVADAGRAGDELGGERDLPIQPTRVATLPRPDGAPFSLVVGSCYFRSSRLSDKLVDAYDALASPPDGDASAAALDGPIYHFWLGDQVYLDEPWKTGFRPVDIADQVAKRYLDNWEIGTATPDPEDIVGSPDTRDPQARFGYVLRRSSNWFLPDDHEFWNGYPQVSFRTLPRHALERSVKNRRNDPGHPFGQGPFGRAAAESFLVFQSAKSPEAKTGRFESDGTEMKPDPVQKIVLCDRGERGADRIVMVDTRWGRTITTGDQGRLMAEDDLVALASELQRPGLVVLMASRPLAGYPARSRKRGQDQVTENYQRQYRILLAAVARRVDAGEPTVIVAGDTHDSAMYSVAQGRLAQIVSSPIVLHGQATPNPNPFAFETLDESVPGDTRPDDFQDLLPDLDGSTGGLVRLDLDVARPGSPVIHYRYRSLDPGFEEQRCRLSWVVAEGRGKWKREIVEPGADTPTPSGPERSAETAGLGLG